MTESCSVCCEEFNKSNRAKVVCQCDYEVCRICVKTYMLSCIGEDHCMSCKVVWSRKFLVESLEKNWMTKKYKEFREDILLSKELAMMAGTQEYVETEIRIEKHKESIININMEIKNLKENKIKEGYSTKDCNMEIKGLKEHKKEIIREFQVEDISEVREKRKFIRQCPDGDCRGFLSSSLKCGICEKSACVDCREIRDDKHKCNKDTLETVKMMKKDTKGCPKCSSLIYKTSGCNMMWCIQCMTFFNWVSLKIELNETHNPEYIEYLRKTGKSGNVRREVGDIQCGRQLDTNFIRNCDFSDKVVEIIRNVIHIERIELRRFEIVNMELRNRQLRINYIRHKIDKTEMKIIIQKKEKENKKKTEISNVLRMYTVCMTDIMYRYQAKESTLNEMSKLKDYTNDCFENIKKCYNCKKWELNENFAFK
jgi:hypothetical protein